MIEECNISVLSRSGPLHHPPCSGAFIVHHLVVITELGVGLLLYYEAFSFLILLALSVVSCYDNKISKTDCATRYRYDMS